MQERDNGRLLAHWGDQLSERDIDTLRTSLPEVFENRSPAEHDWDDVVFVDLTLPGEPYFDSGSLASPVYDEAAWIDTSFSDLEILGTEIREGVEDSAASLAERIGSGFPGALSSPVKAPVLPPDCLAFYLPYHYFHPTWWGVYLLLDGVLHLAQWIRKEAVRRGYSAITPRDCWVSARLFLFYHEIYHHNVESFAARLEVTHRQPLYRSGFNASYLMTVGTPACLEESLAEANAWRQSTSVRFYGKAATAGLREILADYIRISPPGYAEGLRYLKTPAFTRGQNEFAELNHQSSVTPTPPRKQSSIWNSAKYLFRGFNDKAKGRAKYVISKRSPLAARLPLRPRLKPNDVKRRLVARGCEFVRQGGNHEVWRCPGSKPFPIPRHPGELPTGTLRKIIKEAGLDLSIEQFAAEK